MLGRDWKGGEKERAEFWQENLLATISALKEILFLIYNLFNDTVSI